MKIHDTLRVNQAVSKEAAEDLRIAEKFMDIYADLCIPLQEQASTERV